MKTETNVVPHNPISFQVKAALQSVKPLMESGALYMTPAQAPKIANYLRRWGFSVAALINMGALRYPNRLALVDDLGELTYTELRDQTVQMTKELIDRGMNNESSFGVIARNGRGIIIPMAMKAFTGARIMLMNIGASPSQIDALVERNNINYLFIDEEFLPQLPEDMHGCQIVITHLEDPNDRSGLPEGALVMQDLIDSGLHSKAKLEDRPKQSRIVIMSSGTTGLPKGIMRDEPKTPATLGAIVDRVPWRRNLVIHQAASMFHAWGWANVIIAMGTGATLVTHRIFDAKKCIEQCKQYGVNGMISAAIWLRFLKDELDAQPDTKIGPFKFMVSSGNAIPAWLVTALTRRFGPVVCNFYGSTEAGLTTIATGPELAAMPDTAGRPAIGVRLALLDENNNEVPRGEIGRLHCVQEMTFKGYLSEDDKYTTVDGMFEIGDTARMDENGYLYICGRSDDMIIKGGENVFPREVEELVGPMPGVADIYARGVQDDDLIAELHLYVVRDDTSEGEQLSAEAIQSYVGTHLASWSVPDKVIFMDHLPRNGAGKVVPRYIDEAREGDPASTMAARPHADTDAE
ncbi:AMP-binding protein [Corynebacterium sp. TAE3-ERU12]|uniref:AMP-binding protein n=1 Tax=Corynebacterium sp. TAE3-ERU12 TaxID=2849491 RepID=UPI001C46B123|nr:AMP-binding protein [Corynebacterium sp. TAE3-ERU12]MBV7294395.1 AMP-binding protein [Corynebacterium sp. TAE3-ERU12]